MGLQEKWDSMTRRWRDNKALVQMVRLFLIDEVHQLNDETRGATMEAIVSRMKTVTASVADRHDNWLLRFVAVSATIPNITDVSHHTEILTTGIFCSSSSRLQLGWAQRSIHHFNTCMSHIINRITLVIFHVIFNAIRIDETHRPVRLRRVVLGYPDATTEFKFDLSLNYKISGMIQCYSEQKPTLVVPAAFV